MLLGSKRSQVQKVCLKTPRTIAQVDGKGRTALHYNCAGGSSQVHLLRVLLVSCRGVANNRRLCTTFCSTARAFTCQTCRVCLAMLDEAWGFS